jgi:hypothetical protein
LRALILGSGGAATAEIELLIFIHLNPSSATNVPCWRMRAQSHRTRDSAKTLKVLE